MIENKIKPNFCFCTLAVGQEYRNLALLLAEDVAIHAPHSKLVVLTDYPQDFVSQSNIIAFDYQPQSCKLYNDKRLVLAKALSLYDSCIFLDADIRILEKVPEEDINFSPGIVAYSSCSFTKHNFGRKLGKMHRRKAKRIELAQQYMDFYDLNIENIKFVQEYCFYVTKNEHFNDFIKQWEILANWFESHRIWGGEGHIIGLAAAQSGFPLNHDHCKKIKIFKDKMVRVKIKKKKENYQDYAAYFEQRNNAKIKPATILHKIINRYKKFIKFQYRFLLVKLKVLRDSEISNQIYQLQKFRRQKCEP